MLPFLGLPLPFYQRLMPSVCLVMLVHVAVIRVLGVSLGWISGPIHRICSLLPFLSVVVLL